ncbi:uncharacterized protein LOC111700238 isoform X2 [Eurytemora carolleeae]|uniref:uncharacterized protein LOC111700238 isoform X2 n=1 Tax=Eurytemora carolleeae TaxID=1294199 RepID=UPI000C77C97C|nr:uncharacterized protein LOC111700238 isoform X2 [Eurytemora carolleeae]|eukprot:XP_023326874.1 uncharacterized protein LOC111700238 isoform X2 [Eurytemora affinis]
MSLTYDALEKLLVVKKEEVVNQGNGELGKVEKLVQEFFQMKVPHGSEILDVAAGSGILSCLLQSKGYYNIDALDEDLDVIKELKQLNMYRNYIHRILRPEGHLLWTMRAAQDERCAEFGLLLANLRSLERAGRIQIIKHQQFIDYDGLVSSFLFSPFPDLDPCFRIFKSVKLDLDP